MLALFRIASRSPRLVPLVSAVMLPLVLSACGEDGATLGSFTVDEDIAETRVAGGGLGNFLPTSAFPPLALNVESQEEFQAEEFGFVTAIRISGISLEIAASSEDADTDVSENGMPDDFEFLDSLTLSIEATIDGEVTRAELASIDNTDPQLGEGSRRIVLPTSDTNILPYVEADGGYRIVSEASGTVPPDDVVFGGSVDYRVSVGFR